MAHFHFGSPRRWINHDTRFLCHASDKDPHGMTREVSNGISSTSTTKHPHRRQGYRAHEFLPTLGFAHHPTKDAESYAARETCIKFDTTMVGLLLLGTLDGILVFDVVQFLSNVLDTACLCVADNVRKGVTARVGFNHGRHIHVAKHHDPVATRCQHALDLWMQGHGVCQRGNHKGRKGKGMFTPHELGLGHVNLDEAMNNMTFTGQVTGVHHQVALDGYRVNVKCVVAIVTNTGCRHHDVACFDVVVVPTNREVFVSFWWFVFVFLSFVARFLMPWFASKLNRAEMLKNANLYHHHHNIIIIKRSTKNNNNNSEPRL
eukprot:scaffold1924_cov218-Amphora_coffeaeformis.AAC.10